MQIFVQSSLLSFPLSQTVSHVLPKEQFPFSSTKLFTSKAFAMLNAGLLLFQDLPHMHFWSAGASSVLRKASAVKGSYNFQLVSICSVKVLLLLEDSGSAWVIYYTAPLSVIAKIVYQLF